MATLPIAALEWVALDAAAEVAEAAPDDACERMDEAAAERLLVADAAPDESEEATDEAWEESEERADEADAEMPDTALDAELEAALPLPLAEDADEE